MADLDQKLTEYGKSKVYPLHMPGHKRQPLYDMDPFSMDITEIYGFDNLNHPRNLLVYGEKIIHRAKCVRT